MLAWPWAAFGQNVQPGGVGPPPRGLTVWRAIAALVSDHVAARRKSCQLCCKRCFPQQDGCKLFHGEEVLRPCLRDGQFHRVGQKQVRLHDSPRLETISAAKTHGMNAIPEFASRAKTVIPPCPAKRRTRRREMDPSHPAPLDLFHARSEVGRAKQVERCAMNIIFREDG